MIWLKVGWRLCVTGGSFAVFGLCGVLFSICAFPLTYFWPHRLRQYCVTRLVQMFFRALLATLRLLGVMQLELTGVEILRDSGPTIVVANHPTYLDIVVLLALTPRACCVVKGVHWSNPCFWGIVRAAAYISNADPMKFIEDGARQLDAGYTLIIFPEGSRSPSANRMHAFSRGFAHIALKSRRPILPVLMHCEPPFLTKQMRWYEIPPFPFRISVHVQEPIDIRPHAAISHVSPSHSARVVTNTVEVSITRQLFDYGFFKAGN